MFKIKNECKLELQTPETMKLLGGKKKIIDKTKNGENVLSLEVLLVHCNLVNNQYLKINKRHHIQVSVIALELALVFFLLFSLYMKSATKHYIVVLGF